MEKEQKVVAFPGRIKAYHDVNLARFIDYYANKETDALKQPLNSLRLLKLKFSDKLQMLGFAYASIYTCFMGNLTSYPAEKFENKDFSFFIQFLRRSASIANINYRWFDTALSVDNVLGRLHFVSCGSRGLEAFPFLQFVSVFEWEVWLFILLSIALISAVFAKLYKEVWQSINLIAGTFSVYKVLLEQGDPFPASSDTKIQMRFLMCGALLAGLVISNAFKSENVYKIVLPRSHISYYNVDELVEDNVNLYTRIEKFLYMYDFCIPSLSHTSQWDFETCRESSYFIYGSTELKPESNINANILLDSVKIWKLFQNAS